MKKFGFLLVVFVTGMFNFLYAADGNEGEKKVASWYENGTIYGKVYANFHTSGTEFGKQNAFEVNRAYFGYKYTIDEHFSTNVKLDIGELEDIGRRVAFFKNAYLQYKYEKLNMQFGIADAFQFKTQEKFWGYRYIYKSFQDKNKFGSSAELGVFASYKFNDIISADYSINDGEGYGKIQNSTTDNLKHTLGVTVKPIEIITFRVYGDVLSFSDSSQYSLVGFVGVDFKPLVFGFEYVMQKNHDLKIDNDYSGFSTFATYKVSDKFKVFARYDYVRSVELADDFGVMSPWNSGDGDVFIGGVEFAPVKKVQLSLNFQHQMSEFESIGNTSAVYFNLQASF